jgi:urate oxidase
MGEAVLGSFDQIREIRLSLPHRLYTPVDLAPFGMDNPAEVFLPDDEPRGVVEAALRRE